MKLSDKTKRKIYEDFEQCKDKMYSTFTEEESKKISSFYTKPQIIIKMIEKFENFEGDICDSHCGNGLLLSGCIIAGADPKRCYGIVPDENQAQFCRERLASFGVPPENIVSGDCFE